MAINSVLTSNSMVVKYKTGVDGKGNDVFKAQRVKGLSTSITNEEILSIRGGIQKLINHPIKTTRKEQVYIIEESAE